MNPPSASTSFPAGFADRLVVLNARCRSWREKLDAVRGLLAEATAPLTTEQLVDVAVYLRFLAAGQIPCAEDGRHFRPAHHARIAQEIQDRLARMGTSCNAFVLRQIHPWLPSTAPDFLRAEPLTRIRDIAHRNDIPRELKLEIKHTLQNKLHRCAGPEDLRTSGALLARLLQPGAGHPPDFVEQFKIFHEELREFFNARSLEDQVRALVPGLAEADARLALDFLRHKALGHMALQDGTTFGLLTRLRTLLLASVSAQPGSPTQPFLLADIALENFAFVLVSERINTLPNPPQATPWQPLLETLVLTLDNLALSGVEPGESRALESELRFWLSGFDPADREQLLRLKGTADRARRLAGDYCDWIMGLFPPRVEKLGRALGVLERSIRVFCDAEIRSHLVFQLSKLISILLRHLRHDLALPPWDVLVRGEAAGRLVELKSLEELDPDVSGTVVVILKHAQGDEEIPAKVAGVVLAQELPHLSHLGVRARQAGVVFLTCEEKAELEGLRGLLGKKIILTATPESVCWQVADQAAARAGAPRPLVPRRIPEVRLSGDCVWLTLKEAGAQCGGGKAAGALKLAELARLPDSDFQTPRSMVVPFGVMEGAIQSVPALAAEYRALIGSLKELDPRESGRAREGLCSLIGRVPVPAGITAAVVDQFGANARLMVRSSANCEDQEGLAGAGLYESVANVAPVDLAWAVGRVWASLWTGRATLSRLQAGLAHEQARMAVLIQELIAPDLSFVLHTVNPINHNTDELYAELVAGLGETLASAASRGSPYRLVCGKDSHTVLAFANFTDALRPGPQGGVLRQTVDYSRIELSRSAPARCALARRLAAIGRRVEMAFGQAQDIEGVLVEDVIYLVQSRPQPGLPRCREKKNHD